MADKITNILEFYDSILKTAAHETDVDGNISVVYGKNKVAAKLGERDLVMPLRSLLKNPDPDKQIFFHPLCEQITRYESEVFQYFKRATVLRLVTTFSTIGAGLLKLQEDPAIQRKMSIEQTEIMMKISTFDKNSSLNWLKMVMGAVTENKTRMDAWAINVFMKRNGEHGGKHYRRVASVSFPLLEKIVSGEVLYKEGADKSLFRPKDYDTFKEVISAIFPSVGTKTTEFNYGHNETLAPYLIAFLGSVNLIAQRLNYLIDLFKDSFEEVGFDAASVRLDLSWSDMLSAEGLEDLGRYAKSIPVLKGNAGQTSETESDESQEEKPTRREEPVRREVVPEPKSESKTPEPKTDDDGMTEAERKQREEMLEKRRQWQQETQEEEERRKEREERNRRRREEEEEFEQSRRPRRRDDDDDTPPWEDKPKTSKGSGISASELFGRNSSLVKGTRTDEEDYERERGRSRRRDVRDDRDYDRDHDRRDDRDYGRRDTRYRDDDYDRRDRRSYRDDRDDRDYDRRDRGYARDTDRGYRRDDRDYGRRDERVRRSGPWGR